MGKQGFKQSDHDSSLESFRYQFKYQKTVHGSDHKKLGSFKGGYVGKRHNWLQKHFSSIVFTFALIGFLFLLDSIMSSIFEPSVVTQSNSMPEKNSSDTVCIYVFIYVFKNIE